MLEQIGNYTVIRKVSEGGMGEVYLCEHALIGRLAAVKLLLPVMSESADRVERFFNEARAAASIRHPGIVEILDCGRLPDGKAYIVMEYLEGETLGAYLRRYGRLADKVDVVRTIVRQIADALGAAHARGIIHRDLKPENVFLSSENGGTGTARVKILDFGIAKLISAKMAAALTHSKEVVGTPAYFSPEQCQASKNLNHRTDIYSLGCIAFEMLTGSELFAGDSIGELVAAHMFREPPRLLKLEPTIPTVFGEMVLRMLAKSADARPQSMDEVVATIDGEDARTLLRGGAVVLPPTLQLSFTPEAQSRTAAQTSDASHAPAPAAGHAGLDARPGVGGGGGTVGVGGGGVYARVEAGGGGQTQPASRNTASAARAAAFLTQAARKRPASVFAMSAGVVVAGLAGWFATRGQPSASGNAGADGTTSVSSAEPASVKATPSIPTPTPTPPPSTANANALPPPAWPTAAAAEKTVEIVVEDPPPGLRITVDAKPTAMPVILPRGPEFHTFVFEAQGYETMSRSLDASKSRTLVLGMQRLSRDPPRSAPSSAAAPAAPAGKTPKKETQRQPKRATDLFLDL